MATHRANFDSWFVKVLENLYPSRGAGFVILMATFPLIERYLRQRAGLTSEYEKLTRESKFYDELHNFLPELDSRDQVREFWPNLPKRSATSGNIFSKKRN